MLTAEQSRRLKIRWRTGRRRAGFRTVTFWRRPAPVPICPILTSARLRAALRATGISGANMECLGATMQQTAHAEIAIRPRPGYAAKRAVPPSPLTTRLAPLSPVYERAEQRLDLRIHSPGRAPHTLRDYLPDAGPKRLAIKTLLMDLVAIMALR